MLASKIFFCLFKRNGNKLSKTSAILNFSFDIKRQGDCAKFLENAVQRVESEDNPLNVYGYYAGKFGNKGA